VVVGVAFTAAAVDELSVADGVQLYVVAPDAVSDVDAPEHIVALDGVMVTVGVAVTVTAAVAVAVQVPVVPVTV